MSKTFMSPRSFCTLTATKPGAKGVTIRENDNASTSVFITVEGLKDMLAEFEAWTEPQFTFSTYDWLDGQKLPCIRRISDNVMVAAKRGDETTTSNASWRSSMLRQYAKTYPGIESVEV